VQHDIPNAAGDAGNDERPCNGDTMNQHTTAEMDKRNGEASHKPGHRHTPGSVKHAKGRAIRDGAYELIARNRSENLRKVFMTRPIEERKRMLLASRKREAAVIQPARSAAWADKHNPGGRMSHRVRRFYVMDKMPGVSLHASSCGGIPAGLGASLAMLAAAQPATEAQP